MKEGICPSCGNEVEFESALLDTVTGQMGFACPDCDRSYSTGQLRDLQENMFGRPSQRL